MSIPNPPSDALVRYARDRMDQHVEWDSPHEFAVITWDSEMDVLGVTTITLIDTAIHPDVHQLVGGALRVAER